MTFLQNATCAISKKNYPVRNFLFLIALNDLSLIEYTKIHFYLWHKGWPTIYLLAIPSSFWARNALGTFS